MKTRTKLLTAVLSTVTALSCALTVAAAPAITLQGNETTPATVEVDNTATATLTLKATQFDNVGGADLTLTLEEGITLASATVEDVANDANKWVLEKDVNYRVSGNTVKMVDVFNIGDAPTKSSLELKLTFKVSGATIGQKNVTVSAQLADTNEELINDATITGGKLIIGRAKSEVAVGDINNIETEKYFIPFGGAYQGDTWLEKKADGTFDTTNAAAGTVNVLKCKLPADDVKVTTFATGKKEKNPEGKNDYEKADGIQFGSYVIDKTKNYGTFVVIGDYNAFKKANAASYATDKAILERIAALYATNIDSESKFLKLKYNGDKYIYVGRKTRTTYMWEGTNALQYALRVFNVQPTETYTAVGYFVEESTYTFSTEIQTAVFANMQ